jgi:metallo-beta-lactamase class B
MGRVMFGKILATSFATFALLACAPKEVARPVAKTTFPTIKAACGERDGWSDAAPPAHVFGNVYMVGTCGITALLITTPEGHFLIDGATAEAAAGIADNIRKLGIDLKDIRYILATHEHLDHAGGLAMLKAISGAQFATREEARVGMETGLPVADDPQHGLHPAFPGIKAERIIRDGDYLRIGKQAITVMATPGHTPGGISYTWKSCDGADCRTFVYADSLNAVSADAYRFSDHPDYVATLRSSMAKIESLKNCDIMISPHPFQSEFFDRLAGEKPLVDPARCKQYVAAARKRLDDRLAKEASE